jgi:hypothetical protein
MAYQGSARPERGVMELRESGAGQLRRRALSSSRSSRLVELTSCSRLVQLFPAETTLDQIQPVQISKLRKIKPLSKNRLKIEIGN